MHKLSSCLIFRPKALESLARSGWIGENGC